MKKFLIYILIIALTIISIYGIWSMTTEKYLDIKYSLQEEQAREDVKFLTIYSKKIIHNCKSDKIKFTGQYFDEIIKQIKENPEIFAYEEWDFHFKYINDEQANILAHMSDQFPCIKKLNYSLNYISIAGVKRLCNINFKNITFIDLSNNFFSKTDAKELDSYPCSLNINNQEGASLYLSK